MGTRFVGRSVDFALRVFSEDRIRVAHFYLKRDLVDHEWLIPWCEYGKAYPDRHPRWGVEDRGYASADWCLTCTSKEIS